MKDTLKVAFFVIGNLIGAGFFLMPASVAPLGGNLIWSWTIGALIAFTFALIFGKLYVLYPNSKDLSDYFDDIHLKRSIAFLYWIGIVIGNVIVLTMIISVLKIRSFSNALFLAYGLLLILACGNYFFNENDIAKIETILSLLKFFLLILIPIIIFISDYSKVSFPSSHGSISDVFSLGVLSFWSFMGIETAGVFGSGKSARNGLLIGIIACFLLYVSSCFLIVGFVPTHLLLSGGEFPLVYLIQFSKFSYFAQYVSYLIAFTSLASLYGWFTTSSKIALSFAESSIFPHFCKKKTKSGASFWGLWGSTLLTFLAFSLVACFNIGQQFEIIADFCVNISLIIFALCSNVLYVQSETISDNLLSLFGMICVVLLLSINILFSLFSIFLFVFTYYISKYFSK